MNWLWVGVGTLLLTAVLEWQRRSANRFGVYVKDRLKTFSAKVTVAFLSAFAISLPFADIGVGLERRTILLVMVIGLIIANFIRLEGREV